MSRESSSESEFDPGGDATELQSSLVAEPPTPQGCLLYVGAGSGVDQRCAVRSSGEPLIIGRGKECDLVLDDRNVSRQHVRLAMVPGGVLVHDLGSTNGIGYLGRRIERATLPLGARIEVGACQIDILPLENDRTIPASHRQSYGELHGISLPMRRLYTLLESLEQSDAPVLIQGETGTGKELVACAIHAGSVRRDKPLVVIDCGNVPGELMESELFGHRRGAFTGAVQDRAGAFEMADGGTVFLDELGELPPSLQPKLLRVLECGQIKRLGEVSFVTTDVRVISATNRRLADEVAAGRLRQDLYYRVAVVQLEIPPLRDHREDIPLLTRHLLDELSAGSSQRLIDEITPEVEEYLLRHDWPGNVRQLRNVLQQMLAFRRAVGGSMPGSAALFDAELDSDSDASNHLPGTMLPISLDVGFREAKDQLILAFERQYLSQLWAAAAGNLSSAARQAGIDRKHLRALLRKHDLF